MRVAVLVLAALAACPAAAQEHHGHAMPAEQQQADPHAGHTMPATTTEAAPAPPGDHAADAVWDPAAMARARAELTHDGGGMPFARIAFDLAEVRFAKGHQTWRWEGEASYGGDIDRAKLGYEGEGEIGGEVETVELQALYSRAIDPWWNLQTGLRHDFRPGPDRTYAALGIEGTAPYWIEVDAALFVSSKGEVLLRAEASHDLRLTQRLILQPRIEANAALQNVPDLQLGAGLTDFELGLRLRYEVIPEFAPYVGAEWTRKLGGTARLSAVAGEPRSQVGVVAGVRLWF